jgi:hypothetical protein
MKPAQTENPTADELLALGIVLLLVEMYGPVDFDDELEGGGRRNRR